MCVGVRVGAWQTPVDIEGRQMGRHYTHRRNRGRELDTPLSDSAEWVALLIENGEEQLHNVGDAVCDVRAHTTTAFMVGVRMPSCSSAMAESWYDAKMAAEAEAAVTAGTN